MIRLLISISIQLSIQYVILNITKTSLFHIECKRYLKKRGEEVNEKL